MMSRWLVVVCLLTRSIQAAVVDEITLEEALVVGGAAVIDNYDDVKEVPSWVTTLPVSWETQDEFLQLEDELDFSVRKDGKYYPTPIYRKDLPYDYVAYWELEVNDDEFVILAAGPQTGDKKVIHQGERPTPTQVLAREALEIGDRCVRYYMLTPEGTMFCENGNDKVVATTLDPSVVYDFCHENLTESKTKINDLVAELFPVAEADWVAHAEQLDEESIQWKVATVYDRIDCDDDLLSMGDDNDTDVFEQALHPGEAILIAIGGDYESVKVRFIPFARDMSEKKMKKMQKNLCLEALDNELCDEEGNVYDDKIEESDLNGIQYIALLLSEDGDKVLDAFDGNEISFQVEIRLRSGQAIVSRFGIDLYSQEPPSVEVDENDEIQEPPQRKKRYKQYTSWTGFTYHSIHYESSFPKYWQQSYGGCYTGCGPVAWAMVFGYFDRVAHMFGLHGDLRELWRSGWHGTTGSEAEQAPYWHSAKVNRYIIQLRNILHTFCIFGSGATWQWRMDDIESFFNAREGSHVNLWKTDGLVGFYSSSIREKARNLIRDHHIPAVIGRRVGGFFSQHYPVATKYRWRKRQYRHCVKILWWTVCGSWKWEYDRDFYLRMGWSWGSSDGWWNAVAFMAAGAYP